MLCMWCSPLQAQQGECEDPGCSPPLVVGPEWPDDYHFDDDYDADRREDVADNCPWASNRDQLDSDADSYGDACDSCPLVYDDRRDLDEDGLGDACDVDLDGDGVDNEDDNCPWVPNANQADLDDDGVGDGCDDDLDGDGCAEDDLCPWVASSNCADELPAGVCVGDADDDGVGDDIDNCVGWVNPSQRDLNGDGLGDPCDVDRDGDGRFNTHDNCPDAANTTQDDADRDGWGDACDDRYCFVVNNDPATCLDPEGPFAISAATPERDLDTDDRFMLRFFGNRPNTAMRYRWSVVDAPLGSTVRLQHASGSVSFSQAHMYRYTLDEEARFEADTPGRYTLAVEATLAFVPETPGPIRARDVLVLDVEAGWSTSRTVQWPWWLPPAPWDEAADDASTTTTTTTTTTGCAHAEVPQRTTPTMAGVVLALGMWWRRRRRHRRLSRRC